MKGRLARARSSVVGGITVHDRATAVGTGTVGKTVRSSTAAPWPEARGQRPEHGRAHSRGARGRSPSPSPRRAPTGRSKSRERHPRWDAGRHVGAPLTSVGTGSRTTTRHLTDTGMKVTAGLRSDREVQSSQARRSIWWWTVPPSRCRSGTAARRFPPKHRGRNRHLEGGCHANGPTATTTPTIAGQRLCGVPGHAGDGHGGQFHRAGHGPGHAIVDSGFVVQGGRSP